MNDTIIPPSETTPEARESTFRMDGTPEAISALLLAIGKARASMDAVKADTTGQFKDRKFQYADLSSMYKPLMPALAEQGVTVMHPNCQVSPDVQRASTLLAGHGAILMVSHDFNGTPKDENIKGMGSMYTYLNRYQLRGLCAIAGDDDPDNDGQRGTAPFRSQPKPAAPPPGGGRTRAPDREPPVAVTEPKALPQERPDEKLADWDVDAKAPLVKGSETSLKLQELMIAKNMADRVKRDAFVLEVTGIDTSPTSQNKMALTYGDARKLIRTLEGMP